MQCSLNSAQDCRSFLGWCRTIRKVDFRRPLRRARNSATTVSDRASELTPLHGQKTPRTTFENPTNDSDPAVLPVFWIPSFQPFISFAVLVYNPLTARLNFPLWIKPRQLFRTFIEIIPPWILLILLAMPITIDTLLPFRRCAKRYTLKKYSPPHDRRIRTILALPLATRTSYRNSSMRSKTPLHYIPHNPIVDSLSTDVLSGRRELAIPSRFNSLVAPHGQDYPLHKFQQLSP